MAARFQEVQALAGALIATVVFQMFRETIYSTNLDKIDSLIERVEKKCKESLEMSPTSLRSCLIWSKVLIRKSQLELYTQEKLKVLNDAKHKLQLAMAMEPSSQRVNQKMINLITLIKEIDSKNVNHWNTEIGKLKAKKDLVQDSMKTTLEGRFLGHQIDFFVNNAPYYATTPMTQQLYEEERNTIIQ